MALISCPDCGKEVSEQAPACPNCGRPMGNENNWQRTTEGGKFLDPAENGRGCLRVVLIVFVLIIIGYIFSIL